VHSDFVVTGVPVRKAALDVCLRRETVEPTAAERVAGVGRLDSEVSQALTHIAVLNPGVHAAVLRTTSSEAPQRLLADDVSRPIAQITLYTSAQ